MSSSVDWDLAEQTALRISKPDPFAQSYHYHSLQPDFEELTAQAEELVERATGMRSLAGPARARLTDRPDWIRANLASLQRLLRPLTEKLEERIAGKRAAPVVQKLSGIELGAMLGWMSMRVLGQYDILFVEDENPEDQDIVYFVGPNVLALEKRFGFPPRQFRLWLALHEVTHRNQFTAVPWMRSHFVSLVHSTLDQVDPDPKRFVNALKRAAEEIRLGHNPLDEGGIVSLLAGAEQLETLQRLQGLMSLLEGHGDVTMDRAGHDLIPSAERFQRVLHARRASTRGVAKFVQKFVGLEAKLRQYEAGEQFIAEVERSESNQILERVWESPELLPTLGEIRAPQDWITRVQSTPRTPSSTAASTTNEMPDV